MEPTETAGGEYEFTAEEDRTLEKLVKHMREVNLFFIGAGGIGVLGALGALRKRPLDGALGLVSAVLLIVVGAMALRAVTSFERIPKTQGHDITNCMAALRALSEVLTVQLAALVVQVATSAISLVHLASMLAR